MICSIYTNHEKRRWRGQRLGGRQTESGNTIHILNLAGIRRFLFMFSSILTLLQNRHSISLLALWLYQTKRQEKQQSVAIHKQASREIQIKAKYHWRCLFGIFSMSQMKHISGRSEHTHAHRFIHLVGLVVSIGKFGIRHALAFAKNG